MFLALRAITCNDNLGAVCCSFNSSLLRGGSVGVKPYDGKSSFSAMRVLVDARYCEHHRVACCCRPDLSGALQPDMIA